ncbi:MAG TPA: hypothetical protein DDW42_09370 [Desulfobacteraceae bacterium]|nr:hypothetical protein [Desulfobacteraceae bacterium]
MLRKKIDRSIREKVVEAHASGLPMRKIAMEFGVSLSSVSRIVNEKGQRDKITNKEKTERQKKILQLERKVAELEKKIFEAASKKRSWWK